MSFPLPKNGVTIEHNLHGLAKAQVRLAYRGKVAPPPGLDHFEIECEIYEVDGVLAVHSVCPKCRHTVWIDGRNKSIEYSDRGLFVEPFQCTWEMGGEDDRHEFGFGLCNLRLAFDGFVAKDA